MTDNKPLIVTCRQAQELANKLKAADMPITAKEIELMIREALEDGVQLVTFEAEKTCLINAYNFYIINDSKS